MQEKIHAEQYTDRKIMQVTLLTGKPKISLVAVCDRIRTSRHNGKKAIPKPQLLKVIEAGLQGSTIAKVVDPKGRGAAVVLKAIPTGGPERIEYHNELMKLCGISLRELTEAMQGAAEKEKVTAGKKREKVNAREDASPSRSRSRGRGKSAAASSAPPPHHGFGILWGITCFAQDRQGLIDISKGSKLH